ncbi:hypothetical protein VDGL01_11123 [Verticillium dahliae]
MVRLPDRKVLLMSVYVQGRDPEAPLEICRILDRTISATRGTGGQVVDVIVAEDFNRRDHLWGGDDVSPVRQGKADLVKDLMNEHSLKSLLPRGTRTWQAGENESTIDLVLASEDLARALVKCTTYETDHGSDHQAIRTCLDVAMPQATTKPRLLFKNAPWKDTNAVIAGRLRMVPTEGSVQQQTGQAVDVREEVVDDRLDTTASDLHVLEEPGHIREESRPGQPWTGAVGERSIQTVPWRHRRQKKSHWDDFLVDNSNIWKATKYLDKEGDVPFDKLPQLLRADGTRTTNGAEQAEELLTTSFPPLPDEIPEEGPRPQRAPTDMPEITLGEIEAQLFRMRPWKAPGDDGLPVMLFRASAEEGVLPRQWIHAKIVPLNKPDKGDYKIARAWRPISLLSTLGKVLEAVMAERIAYAVEEFGLLPSNHFEAQASVSRKALVLLQEHIFKAWRGRKIVGLISFDVKGAYNGVCKERLLQRLTARGIHRAFCSGRTASIEVNGQPSEKRDLPQAGLPQGSPLSPVLFLFNNADLVQHRIGASGGAVAFVDDYTAWVVGPTAEANREGIQSIIDRALKWEARSWANFEGDKTAIIHFSRNAERVGDTPFTVRGQTVRSKEQVAEMHAVDAGMDLEWEVIDVDLKVMEEAGKGEWGGVRRRYWTLDRKSKPAPTVSPVELTKPQSTDCRYAPSWVRGFHIRVAMSGLKKRSSENISDEASPSIYSSYHHGRRPLAL